MNLTRRFGRNLTLSLSGSLIPALVGVTGTLLLVRLASPSASVGVLAAWTLLGYMTLSDLGLTRSSSKLVSSSERTPLVAIGTLWRTSLLLGAALGVLTIVASNFTTPWFLLLVPVPLLFALQFPVTGALEAMGRFEIIAAQRLINSVSIYLIPPLAITLFGDQTGLIIGLAMITTCRIGLFWLLFASTRVSLGACIKVTFDRTHASQHRLVFWIGVSSIVGPALLYVDRIAIALAGFPDEIWVFYTALSELLMKSYVIPSAILSVVFPLLAARTKAHFIRIRRISLLWAPMAVAVGNLLFIAACVFVPRSWVDGFIPSEHVDVGLVLLVVMTASTTVNWVSQIYIAILQAFDQQRLVASWQIGLAVPFLAALAVAAASGSIVAIAAVSLVRVLCLSLILAVGASRTLAR